MAVRGYSIVSRMRGGISSSHERKHLGKLSFECQFRGVGCRVLSFEVPARGTVVLVSIILAA
jgi:hypothetical protein